MIEVVVLAVVVIMLGVTLILYRRNGRAGSGGRGRSKAPAAASYYNDVGTLPMQPGMAGGATFAPMGGGQPDPFAGFGAGGPAPGMAPPPPPPPGSAARSDAARARHAGRLDAGPERRTRHAALLGRRVWTQHVAQRGG